MAITKAQKQVMLERLETVLNDAKSVTFVHFNALNAADDVHNRITLREKGVEYWVVKKTLLKIAIEKSNVTGDLSDLPGNIAITYSMDDATAPAREIHELATAKKGEFLSIVGGIFENKLQSKEEMMEIALIPSLDVLRGMFANVINSPIQGLVIALNALAEKKEE